MELSKTEIALARSCATRTAIKVGAGSLLFLLIAIYSANWVLFDVYDLLPINIAAAVVAIFVGIGLLVLWIQLDSLDAPWRIRLKLTELRDRKKLLAERGHASWEENRSSYLQDAKTVVERLGADSNRYRSIHNSFQGIVIVGSLATTATASLSLGAHNTGWITVVLSFAVGLSAGFTGYFKYRERGYYLQVTADAIAEEIDAFELGIGRYNDRTATVALADFVAEVHRLRNEQKRREQNLDQPTDLRSGIELS